MKTSYLCEPSVTTNISISMCLIKVFIYDIKYNYVILEVSILLEERHQYSEIRLIKFIDCNVSILYHFTIFDHNLYFIHVQAALSKIWVFACYSRRIVANRSICTLMKQYFCQYIRNLFNPFG
jgi:hypothetical protein